MAVDTMVLIEDSKGLIGRLVATPAVAAVTDGTWQRGALYLTLAGLMPGMGMTQQVELRATMDRLDRREQQVKVRRARVSEGRMPWRARA